MPMKLSPHAASATLVTVATCSLDQWALDFDGNLRRIKASIRAAKAAGARYRLGPELEVCGYGCEDHFLEVDTFTHCWQSMAVLLADASLHGILCDIGMPVLHRGARYNARVFVLDGRILLVRPKLSLADDGNYREGRWFTAWHHDWSAPRPLEELPLPPFITELTGQVSAPFGVAALEAADGISVASETCEELFTPASPHIPLSLLGVDILANGSGSHHQLRKLHTRVDLMRGATARCGGVYLYANQQGCDGGRLYYDGCAMVLVNGECVGQGSQFSLRDVEVVTATVDVADVRSMRAATASRGVQAAATPPIPRVHVDISLAQSAAERRRINTVALAAAAASASSPSPSPSPRGAGTGTGASASGGAGAGAGADAGSAHDDVGIADVAVVGERIVPACPSHATPVHYLEPEEEIALGPACWLWDYLRRSGACGFFLPLSGGADSAATASIVGVMCTLLWREVVMQGNATVAADLRRVLRESPDYLPSCREELAHRLLHTCFMATAHSSDETRARARAVAGQIGAYHLHAVIDGMVAAVIAVFVAIFTATGGRDGDPYGPGRVPPRSSTAAGLLAAGGSAVTAGVSCLRALTAGSPAPAAQLPVSVASAGSGGSTGSAGSSRHSSAGDAAKLSGERTASGSSSSSSASEKEKAEVTALLTPRFGAHGGSRGEDLALQNIQARLRMVLAYVLAQLLPWARAKLDGRKPSPGAASDGSGSGSGSGWRRPAPNPGGWLLVLGSANVDEALRGYMTKYDCSSADVNPIGAIAKGDLKRFLLYAGSERGYGYSALLGVVAAPPTAELQPPTRDAKTGAVVEQLDEVDMGMSYEELGWFGRLRKNARCGPLSMYLKLRDEWAAMHSPRVVAEKVKRFFTFYGRNRHKMTTLTPSYHAESYSPDDNRYDLRPFLYPAWERQFTCIDADVAAAEAEAAEALAAVDAAAGAGAARPPAARSGPSDSAAGGAASPAGASAASAAAAAAGASVASVSSPSSAAAGAGTGMGGAGTGTGTGAWGRGGTAGAIAAARRGGAPATGGPGIAAPALKPE